MINVIYYKNSTGEIISFGNAINELDATNDAVADNASFVVVTEFPRALSNCYIDTVTKVAIVKSASPSVYHKFNYTSKQWEDPRSLQDLKDAQWDLIKQSRADAEYAGFTWDGSVFDSDALSQNRITGAVTLAQMDSNFTIGWTLADNTVRTMSQMDMLQTGAALGTHVATVFSMGVVKRNAIEAATTKEDVEAIVW